MILYQLAILGHLLTSAEKPKEVPCVIKIYEIKQKEKIRRFKKFLEEMGKKEK